MANNKQVCKFYANGKCKYGNSCRYAHIDQKNGNNNSSGSILETFLSAATLETKAKEIRDDLKQYSWWQSKPALSSFGLEFPAVNNLISGRDLSFEEQRLQYMEAVATNQVPQFEQTMEARKQDMEYCIRQIQGKENLAARYQQRSAEPNVALPKPFVLESMEENVEKVLRDPNTLKPKDSNPFGGANPFASTSESGFGAASGQQNSNIGFGTNSFGSSGFGSSGFGSSGFGSSGFGTNLMGGAPGFGSSTGSSTAAFGSGAKGVTSTSSSDSPFGSSGFGGNVNNGAFSKSAFGASGFGLNSAAGNLALGQSTGGQNLATNQLGFGKTGFGQTGFGSTNTEKKDGATSGFGSSGFGSSGFGSSGFGSSGGSSGFGSSGFGSSGFGSSGFGSSGFGKAAPSTNLGFGNSAFGQTSAAKSSPFGQQASNNSASPFGQPAPNNASTSTTSTSNNPFASNNTNTAPFGASPWSSNTTTTTNNNTNNTTNSSTSNAFSSSSHTINQLGSSSNSSLAYTPEDIFLEYDPKVIEAYQASEFKLGQVPEAPPPITLCK